MPVGEVLNIVQLGDVAIQQHAAPYPESRLRTKGKAEQALDSYRVILPHNPGIPEVREYRIETVIYASYQRSTSHLYHSLMRLLNRVTDIIGLEIIGPGHTNWMQPPVIQPDREYSMWYHNRGRITDLSPKSENAQSLELRIELETYSFWQPLNPAIWYAATRDVAVPAFNERAAFSSSEISDLPRAERFYDSHHPMAFQKKIYADTSFHYNPTYFTELTAQQDDDLPRTRYTADWDGGNYHAIFVDPERWSASPLSIYLFQNLVTVGTSFNIEVTHEGDIWSRHTDNTEIDFDELDAAVTDAGFTLLDTDILVIGDVDGHAFMLRDGAFLCHVASAMYRTGGAWPGQLYPGLNEVNIHADGSSHAQHHIFRRL